MGLGSGVRVRVGGWGWGSKRADRHHGGERGEGEEHEGRHRAEDGARLLYDGDGHAQLLAPCEDEDSRDQREHLRCKVEQLEQGSKVVR